MIDSGLLTGLPLFASLNRAHPILLDQSIRLLLLIPGLAMELGLYAVVLVLLLRAKPRPTQLTHAEPRSTALFFTLVGLVLTLFLSSSVISNNDFGYRAVMLPQFFLLLLTADLLGSWRTIASTQTDSPLQASPTTRRVLYTLLILGIAGSVYGAVLLRAWLPREAHLTPQTTELDFTQLPSDAFQIRSAFDTLHHIASPPQSSPSAPSTPKPTPSTRS